MLVASGRDQTRLNDSLFPFLGAENAHDFCVGALADRFDARVCRAADNRDSNYHHFIKEDFDVTQRFGLPVGRRT